MAHTQPCSVNIKAEEFPALNTKADNHREKRTRRSSSALSSVSTTSIGAFKTSCTEVTWKLNSGNYYNKEEIYVRPFLSCWCTFCVDKSKHKGRPDYLREADWELCEKAQFFERGYTMKVSDSKVVRHKRTRKSTLKFSVAYVEMENGVRGWVRSKTLKARQTVQSESALRDLAFEKYQAEVDRSRSPSVCSSGSSMVPPPLFKFGEVVLCRIKTGEWVRGEVHCEHPLKIMHAGANRPFRFSFHNVKKYPVRKFVAVEDIVVRTVAATDNWGAKAVLKKGTDISVAYMEGFEGRITAPICGWITMRSKHSLNVVTKNCVFTECNPTLFIKNVPGSMTEVQLLTMLQQNAYVTPKSIVFQEKDGRYRAVVEFVHHSEGAPLVDLGEVTVDGKQTLKFSWAMDYLRSKSMSKVETDL